MTVPAEPLSKVAGRPLGDETAALPVAGRDRRDRQRRRRRSAGKAVPLRGLLPIVVLLVLWQLVGSRKSVFFPVPSEWWSSISTVARGGELWSALSSTALTFVVALAIATVLGAAVGVLIGSVQWSARAFNPLLDYLRNLPVAALVPVAAIILGTTANMAITVTAFSALWPVLLNAAVGIRGLSPVLINSLDNLELGPWRRRWLMIGAALPNILVGVRIAAPLALVVTLLAEFITNLSGLGALLLSAQQTFASAELYGLLVVAGILALVVNAVVVAITVPIESRHGLK